MATTIEALRNLGLKVNGEEPQSNYVNNVINEIADNYSPSEAGMSNPMTTAGDIIVGGTSGAPTRLAKGTQGQVLSVGSSGLEWANAASGGGTQLYKHSIPFQFIEGEDTMNMCLEFVNTRSTPYPNDTYANFSAWEDQADEILYQAVSKVIRAPGIGHEGADAVFGILSGEINSQGTGNFTINAMMLANPFISPISSIDDIIMPIESTSAQYSTYTDTVTAL